MSTENGGHTAVVTNGNGNQHVSTDNNSSSSSTPKKPYWRIYLFITMLAIDFVSSILLMTPLIPVIPKIEGDTRGHYTFYGRLFDLAALTYIRIMCSLVGLLFAYCQAEVPPEYYPFSLYHANGEKKTREELEEEALEESFWPWCWRFVTRPAFFAEIIAVATQVVCVVKSLWRMNMEIGLWHDTEPFHPVFWLAILWAAVLSLLEGCTLDSVCQLAAAYGENKPQRTFLRNISSTLTIPLLAAAAEDQTTPDEEQPINATPEAAPPETEARGVSDISGDANYKASIKDLLQICSHDFHLLILAFVFLILAAVAQTLIPLYLGHILDALTKAFANKEKDEASVLEVPGFIRKIELLVFVSICAGVFSGFRGA